MTARIMLEFDEMPEAEELAMVVSLAKKINAKVIGLSGQNQSPISAPIQLGFEKFPLDLDAFAVSPAQIDALSSTFKDELSAEELCAMLTS
ncbi:MAG: hypothetical protein IPN76_00295 [Saprospiraceae bacterium]|nr:hypothetical protein [Saprospiraceae bacterium]